MKKSKKDGTLAKKIALKNKSDHRWQDAGPATNDGKKRREGGSMRGKQHKSKRGNQHKRKTNEGRIRK